MVTVVVSVVAHAMYHCPMRRRLAIPGALLLLPAAAMARDNVVPANPMTRDAVQVPLSFVSYETRTGLTEYAAGGGFHLSSWLLGGAIRYHLADKTENQLVHARGPADGAEIELVFGNSGNLFSDVHLDDLCRRQGMKPDDCLFSDLDTQYQEIYRERGPVWDVPVMALLVLGGSYQELTMTDPADRSREQGQHLWGARARLAIGAYLDESLLALSGGVATVGAAPPQVSYCTPVAPSGTVLTCAPAYLEPYNRTTIVDARLEWRRNVVRYLGFNPAVQAVFQHSERDDAATANDDTVFGLRYVDLDLPLYFYIHYHDAPGFYAGLRAVMRWWQVDRASQVELTGGFFVSLAYGGARQRVHERRFEEVRILD
jgi:hypothetical protein